MPEVLISRERVLAAAKAAPPGPVPRLPLPPPKPSAKNNYKPLYLRAKQRYFEELAAIQGEVGGDESDDENYPEGPPELSTRRKKQVNIGQVSKLCKYCTSALVWMLIGTILGIIYSMILL